MKTILSAAVVLLLAVSTVTRAGCTPDEAMNKMIALNQLNIKLQGEVPLDPTKDPEAMNRAFERAKVFSEAMAKAGPLLAEGKFDEACAIYDKVAKDFDFSFLATPSLTMDDLRKDGGAGAGGECDVTQAAERMLALAEDFEKAYAAGKFSYERQREFSKDSETAAALTTVDPSKACQEIAALRQKYGL